jgi:hypothetical protein
MISLKKYLDDLAGPNHPFVKGVTVEGLLQNTESKEMDLKKNEAEQAQWLLDKFLRTNKN